MVVPDQCLMPVQIQPAPTWESSRGSPSGSASQCSSVLLADVPEDRKVSARLVHCGEDWVAWPQVPFLMQSGTESHLGCHGPVLASQANFLLHWSGKACSHNHRPEAWGSFLGSRVEGAFHLLICYLLTFSEDKGGHRPDRVGKCVSGAV